MQNAGQYGPGAANQVQHQQQQQQQPQYHPVPISEPSPTGSSTSTTSLRHFRKKDVEKSPESAGAQKLEARVAPHSHYPPSHQPPDYRYPPMGHHQYQDFSLNSSGPQPKYDQGENQNSPISTSVIQKPKHMEICQQSPGHLKQAYQAHQLGPSGYHQGYGMDNNQIMQPLTQMHPSAYKPSAESQYYVKDQYSHQLSHHPQKYHQMMPPQNMRKYTNPGGENFLAKPDSFLSKLSKLNPTMARSIMSEHHLQESLGGQAPSYPMDQRGMYQNNQRYYAGSSHPSQMGGYPSNNYSPMNYPNYPPSCNYTRPGNMTAAPPNRYNPQLERDVSPSRRSYSDNLQQMAICASMPHKMSHNYPPQYHATPPEYAQHYRHRRDALGGVIPQEYYQQAGGYGRPPQYMGGHQLPPAQNLQDMAESGPIPPSDNIKKFVENWMEEEENTADIPNGIDNGTLNVGDQIIQVSMVNPSDVQYLENRGIPVVTPENGHLSLTQEGLQYLIKTGIDPQTIKIIEASNKESITKENGTQEKVVRLHIVDQSKTDCMLANTNQNFDPSDNRKIIVQQNKILPHCNNISGSLTSDFVERIPNIDQNLENVGVCQPNNASCSDTKELVDKNCSPINLPEFSENLDSKQIAEARDSCIKSVESRLEISNSMEESRSPTNSFKSMPIIDAFDSELVTTGSGSIQQTSDYGIKHLENFEQTTKVANETQKMDLDEPISDEVLNSDSTSIENNSLSQKNDLKNNDSMLGHSLDTNSVESDPTSNLKVHTLKKETSLVSENMPCDVSDISRSDTPASSTSRSSPQVKEEPFTENSIVQNENSCQNVPLNFKRKRILSIEDIIYPKSTKENEKLTLFHSTMVFINKEKEFSSMELNNLKTTKIKSNVRDYTEKKTEIQLPVTKNIFDLNANINSKNSLRSTPRKRRAQSEPKCDTVFTLSSSDSNSNKFESFLGKKDVGVNTSFNDNISDNEICPKRGKYVTNLDQNNQSKSFEDSAILVINKNKNILSRSYNQECLPAIPDLDSSIFTKEISTSQHSIRIDENPVCLHLQDTEIQIKIFKVKDEIIIKTEHVSGLHKMDINENYDTCNIRNQSDIQEIIHGQQSTLTNLEMQSQYDQKLESFKFSAITANLDSTVKEKEDIENMAFDENPRDASLSNHGENSSNENTSVPLKDFYVNQTVPQPFLKSDILVNKNHHSSANHGLAKSDFSEVFTTVEPNKPKETPSSDLKVAPSITSSEDFQMCNKSENLSNQENKESDKKLDHSNLNTENNNSVLKMDDNSSRSHCATTATNEISSTVDTDECSDTNIKKSDKTKEKPKSPTQRESEKIILCLKKVSGVYKAQTNHKDKSKISLQKQTHSNATDLNVETVLAQNLDKNLVVEVKKPSSKTKSKHKDGLKLVSTKNKLNNCNSTLEKKQENLLKIISCLASNENSAVAEDYRRNINLNNFVNESETTTLNQKLCKTKLDKKCPELKQNKIRKDFEKIDDVKNQSILAANVIHEEKLTEVNSNKQIILDCTKELNQQVILEEEGDKELLQDTNFHEHNPECSSQTLKKEKFESDKEDENVTKSVEISDDCKRQQEKNCVQSTDNNQALHGHMVMCDLDQTGDQKNEIERVDYVGNASILALEQNDDSCLLEKVPANDCQILTEKNDFLSKNSIQVLPNNLQICVKDQTECPEIKNVVNNVTALTVEDNVNLENKNYSIFKDTSKSFPEISTGVEKICQENTSEVNQGQTADTTVQVVKHEIANASESETEILVEETILQIAEGHTNQIVLDNIENLSQNSENDDHKDKHIANSTVAQICHKDIKQEICSPEKTEKRNFQQINNLLENQYCKINEMNNVEHMESTLNEEKNLKFNTSDIKNIKEETSETNIIELKENKVTGLEEHPALISNALIDIDQTCGEPLSNNLEQTELSALDIKDGEDDLKSTIIMEEPTDCKGSEFYHANETDEEFNSNAVSENIFSPVYDQHIEQNFADSSEEIKSLDIEDSQNETNFQETDKHSEENAEDIPMTPQQIDVASCESTTYEILEETNCPYSEVVLIQEEIVLANEEIPKVGDLKEIQSQKFLEASQDINICASSEISEMPQDIIDCPTVSETPEILVDDPLEVGLVEEIGRISSSPDHILEIGPLEDIEVRIKVAEDKYEEDEFGADSFKKCHVEHGKKVNDNQNLSIVTDKSYDVEIKNKDKASSVYGSPVRQKRSGPEPFTKSRDVMILSPTSTYNEESALPPYYDQTVSEKRESNECMSTCSPPITKAAKKQYDCDLQSTTITTTSAIIEKSLSPQARNTTSNEDDYKEPRACIRQVQVYLERLSPEQIKKRLSIKDSNKSNKNDIKQIKALDINKKRKLSIKKHVDKSNKSLAILNKEDKSFFPGTEAMLRNKIQNLKRSQRINLKLKQKLRQKEMLKKLINRRKSKNEVKVNKYSKSTEIISNNTIVTKNVNKSDLEEDDDFADFNELVKRHKKKKKLLEMKKQALKPTNDCQDEARVSTTESKCEDQIKENNEKASEEIMETKPLKRSLNKIALRKESGQSYKVNNDIKPKLKLNQEDKSKLHIIQPTIANTSKVKTLEEHSKTLMQATSQIKVSKPKKLRNIRKSVSMDEEKKEDVEGAVKSSEQTECEEGEIPSLPEENSNTTIKTNTTAKPLEILPIPQVPATNESRPNTPIIVPSVSELIDEHKSFSKRKISLQDYKKKRKINVVTGFSESDSKSESDSPVVSILSKKPKTGERIAERTSSLAQRLSFKENETLIAKNNKEATNIATSSPKEKHVSFSSTKTIISNPNHFEYNTNNSTAPMEEKRGRIDPRIKTRRKSVEILYHQKPVQSYFTAPAITDNAKSIDIKNDDQKEKPHAFSSEKRAKSQKKSRRKSVDSYLYSLETEIKEDPALVDDERKIDVDRLLLKKRIEIKNDYQTHQHFSEKETKFQKKSRRKSVDSYLYSPETEVKEPALYEETNKILLNSSNDWEDSNSPKHESMPNDDSLNVNFSGLINRNSKPIIDVDELKLTIDPKYNADLEEGDNPTPQVSLEEYKERIDSQLSSLSIHIPKPTREHSTIHPKFNIEDINRPLEKNVLIQRFRKGEKITDSEMEIIKRIITYKRFMLQNAPSDSISVLSGNSQQYELKHLEEDDMKLHFKRKIEPEFWKNKMPETFNNYYAERRKEKSMEEVSGPSRGWEEEQDEYGECKNQSLSYQCDKINSHNNDYSIQMQFCNSEKDKLPKIIFKRTKSSDEPVVVLERLQMQRVEEKLNVNVREGSCNSGTKICPKNLR